jgi:hypothetical protein
LDTGYGVIDVHRVLFEDAERIENAAGSSAAVYVDFGQVDLSFHLALMAPRASRLSFCATPSAITSLACGLLSFVLGHLQKAERLGLSPGILYHFVTFGAAGWLRSTAAAKL